MKLLLSSSCTVLQIEIFLYFISFCDTFFHPILLIVTSISHGEAYIKSNTFIHIDW